MRPEDQQESLFDFPYHHLPAEDPGGAWRVGRHLSWGYEYLGRLRAVRELVLKHQPQRVLDFGCGDGRLIVELVRAGVGEIIGADISARALLFARAATYGASNVHFVSDLNVVDARLRPVDTVVAMEVLEHLPPDHLRPTLVALHEILHPSGILVITVPTANVPLNPKHYQHFSVESLSRELDGLFRLVECRFLHRIGALASLLRYAVSNRWFIANHTTWLRWATSAYQRLVMIASARNAAQLICTFQPVHRGRRL